MEQQSRIYDAPVEQAPTNEFASLALAREYIDTARARISASAAHELVNALERLDRAYHEFPELFLARPRGEVLKGLRSVAGRMPDRAAIPLLMYCIASDPSCSPSVTSLLEKIAGSDSWQSLTSVLRSLCRSRRLTWSRIKPIIDFSRQQGRTNTGLQVISELLDCVKLDNEETATDIGDILICLLSDDHSRGIDGGALAEALRSARHRLNQPPLDPSEVGSRGVLLAMAERFRNTSSHARLDHPHSSPTWPSGRMSFDEFLLQWPCEIELPFDLDEADFIEEVYRAILLRRAEAGESDQYLRLLREGAVSKTWIIEDLLASEECRTLERRLRVIWGDHVITEPGSSGDEEMPAVTWPRGSTS